MHLKVQGPETTLEFEPHDPLRFHGEDMGTASEPLSLPLWFRMELASIKSQDDRSAPPHGFAAGAEPRYSGLFAHPGKNLPFDYALFLRAPTWFACTLLLIAPAFTLFRRIRRPKQSPANRPTPNLERPTKTGAKENPPAIASGPQ